jgi:hypothetical protein
MACFFLNYMREYPKRLLPWADWTITSGENQTSVAQRSCGFSTPSLALWCSMELRRGKLQPQPSWQLMSFSRRAWGESKVYEIRQQWEAATDHQAVSVFYPSSWANTRWFGHLIWMPPHIPAKTIHDFNPVKPG